MCLDCADNIPQLYCMPSILLIMCLDCTGHPLIQNGQLIRISVLKATQKHGMNAYGSEI